MWITRVAIRNPVFATMVMVALCVLGVFSYAQLGVEQMPDINLPGAFVDVAYPGASPEAVEREINKPIEEALNSIAGVKRITSRAFEGRGQTGIEFTLSADLNRAMQEVRDKVAAVRGRLPRDIDPPVVDRVDPDATPILAIMLAGPDGIRTLSEFADKRIKPRLERVPGVGSIEVVTYGNRMEFYHPPSQKMASQRMRRWLRAATARHLRAGPGSDG